MQVIAQVLYFSTGVSFVNCPSVEILKYFNQVSRSRSVTERTVNIPVLWEGL